MIEIQLFWLLTMKKRLKSNSAQSIIEYTVVLILLIGIMIVAGAYYKRSLQGRYRQAGDILGGGEQYTP